MYKEFKHKLALLVYFLHTEQNQRRHSQRVVCFIGLITNSPREHKTALLSLAEVSNLQPRMAVDAAQHKIINLLKT